MSLSEDLKPHLEEFARSVGFQIDAEDIGSCGEATDFIGEFINDTSYHSGLLEDMVGNFSLLRPRMENGILQPVVRRELLAHELIISVEGQTKPKRYSFRFRIPNEDNEWAGCVLCHGRFLYLLGFGQKNRPSNPMMMIFTAQQGTSRGKPNVCVGSILMHVTQFTRGEVRELSVGRIAALVRKSQSYERNVEKAVDWLLETQKAGLPYSLQPLGSACGVTGSNPGQPGTIQNCTLGFVAELTRASAPRISTRER